MSGGSWDYFYKQLNDVADRLCAEQSPLRRAFGEHLRLCAAALHDIEWVDSGDYGKDDELIGIRRVLEDTASEKSAEQVRAEITRLRDALTVVLK